MKRVLLIGAGHAHLELLRRLKEEPLYGASMALVSPTALQPYSGMLPGVVAGHYRLSDAQVDVAQLAGRLQVEFVEGELASLDPTRRLATLASGAQAEYDYISINAGSLVDDSLPGAREHALPVKPFQRFLRELGSPRRIAIAGGGAAGAELAMALRHAGGLVTLYSDKPSMSPGLAQRLQRALRRRGVDFRPGMAVSAIERGPLVIAGTSRQEFDRVLLATGAKAQPWLKASGLATDERGFALVHPTLQSVSHPEVFVAGDCASLQHPKSGVYAVRHGEVLEQTLRNLMDGKPPVPYVPQPRALSLVTCGTRYAIADWGRWSTEGRWVWWWKDRIDRQWMRSFTTWKEKKT